MHLPTVSSSSSSSSIPMLLDHAESAGAVSRTNSVAQRTFHIAGELRYKDRFIKRSFEHISGQNADIVFQLELKNNKILRVPEYYLTNPEDVLKENVFDRALNFSKTIAQTVQKGRKRLASPNAEIPPSKKGPEQQTLIPFALPDYQEKTFQAWINYRIGNDQDLTLSDEELKELLKYSNYIQEPGLSRLALSLLTQLPNVEDHAEFLLRELVEKDWALDTSTNEYQHFENFLTNFSVWQHVLSPDFTQWLNQKVEDRPIAACILAIFYDRIPSQNETGSFHLELARKAGGHPLGIALQARYLPLGQKQERLDLAGRALEQKSLYGGFVLAFINDSVSEHVHTAAAKGLTDAMGWLALSYFEGKRGLAQNESLAFEWWSKAAEKGNAGAIYKTSICYLSGKGVLKDEAQALQLLIKAAKKANFTAMHYLGSCYFKGSSGVDKDETQAFHWWLKAAEKGCLDAMSKVGICYYTGIVGVVPQDAAQAGHWWSKAAAKGHPDAMNLQALWC